MFLNCLLLDLTVIDLISIVHIDTIWVEIAKIFEMRTSGGGGSSVISDTPGRGGEGGGSKKGKFLRTSFMDGPYSNFLLKLSTQTFYSNFLLKLSLVVSSKFYQCCTVLPRVTHCSAESLSKN